MHVYHASGPTTPEALKPLMVMYAPREDELTDCCALGYWSDLHQASSSVRASVEDYSLKTVEAFMIRKERLRWEGFAGVDALC